MVKQNDEMVCYTARLSEPKLSKKELGDILSKYSTSYVIGYEVGELNERPHYQIYFESRSLKRTLEVPFRNQAKAAGLKGNAGWFLQVCEDRIKTIAYCLKDNDYLIEGISEADLQVAKEYDISVKNGLKTRKSNKRTQLQCIEDVYAEELKSLPHRGFGIAEITKLVVRYFKESGTLIREFALVSIVQTLALKYVPEYQGDLERRLLDKVLMK